MKNECNTVIETACIHLNLQLYFVDHWILIMKIIKFSDY